MKVKKLVVKVLESYGRAGAGKLSLRGMHKTKVPKRLIKNMQEL